MLYARALLLVRELHHLRRCVLVLINESTFGKEGGELKTSLGSASKFVEVHNKFMTLGGVIVGAVYYLAKDLGIRNTRLEEGLKRLDEKQESERRERQTNATRVQMQNHPIEGGVGYAACLHRQRTPRCNRAGLGEGEGGGEGGEGGGEGDGEGDVVSVPGLAVP